MRILRSFDYSHFEITLGATSDTTITTSEVDELRKTAARLADKAVEQYQIAKRDAARRVEIGYTKQQLAREVTEILANVPESERTPEQKAKVKKLEDDAYWSRRYDYEDQWNED